MESKGIECNGIECNNMESKGIENKKVSIIGLGLIGGSLAKALHERAGITDITAVNRSCAPIEQALKDGVISRGFNSINEYVWNSDIVFICTPVKYTVQYFDAVAKNAKPGCIITDVGSTKAEIIDYVNSLGDPPCFIGGHPMAGTEKTGYLASFSHLFENAYYILSPSRFAGKDDLNLLAGIVKSMGGLPVTLDAVEHDRITGSISHVPHIIASALVNMIRETDSHEGKMQMLAAGGFRDITRIASSDPEMWESIIMSNKVQVENILKVYIELLIKIRNDIIRSDPEKIYSFFESARDYRNTFSSNRKGLISPIHDIMVDVVDKPGIIGEIATTLGNSSINIKNINVTNSREFEPGCLRITLPDSGSAEAAFRLLSSGGYRVYRAV